MNEANNGMTARKKQTPLLLVSVRNATEAEAAMSGGVDLLDIKEPDRGSLGAADAATLRNVLKVVQSRPSPADITVSAALGEAVDWRSDSNALILPAGIRYAKMGLAGVHQDSNWKTQWCAAREQVERHAQATFEWIAVAYADWQSVDAPSPHEVLSEAANERFAGLLLDTSIKDGRNVFDRISPAALSELRVEAQAAGLMFALAGSLSLSMLPQILEIAPDIVAIRGGACRNFDRRAEISSEAVCEWKTALQTGHATNCYNEDGQATQRRTRMHA